MPQHQFLNKWSRDSVTICVFTPLEGLICHIGDDLEWQRTAPASVGPVPDYVMESVGHLGQWTPMGRWNKSVKAKQRKEEKRLMREVNDPSLPINQLPYNVVSGALVRMLDIHSEYKRFKT